ncbi:uncharacterized protein LOC110108571 [Dendrobium catenatum]|uniref:uncharacterized protein LOC110108571 n=1 Tax=Dendrobium catenatum TaxID=906689 RepID=UPI0009F2D868|nr:uncharacterized protein LOC110108571 [Dendrobium catenatum]
MFFGCMNIHASCSQNWKHNLASYLGFFLITIFFSSLEDCVVKGLDLERLTQESFGSVSLDSYYRNQYHQSEEGSCLSSLNSVSCQDLKGIGSLNETCIISSNLSYTDDLCIYGTGNLEISPGVSIICAAKGCYVTVNISGIVRVGSYAEIIAGSIIFVSTNLSLDLHSTINTAASGGPPPEQTSGTPIGYDGAGGGHGGRGASCLKSNKTNWGGDVYAWSTLSEPWSYGSKGGSTSADKLYGGDGGGRIKFDVRDLLNVDGLVTADGGAGGLKGGGGSGGSILIYALKLKGKGTISAAGGSGWGGGGGGRISLVCYAIQDVTITVHGLH